VGTTISLAVKRFARISFCSQALIGTGNGEGKMKRATKMSKPHSHWLLYLAFYILSMFLLFGCGSSGGSGSEAAASNETGSIAASLEFQGAQQSNSALQAAQDNDQFNCEGINTVLIKVLDENEGRALLASGEARCTDRSLTLTGIKAGSNRTVTAHAMDYSDPPNVIYSGETESPITITAGETKKVKIALKQVRPIDNLPPVANAGSDMSVDVGSEVTLDGSASSDPEDKPLTFSWSFITLPLGSDVKMDDTTAEKPKFRAEDPGTYVVQLIVNDGTQDSLPDTVTITTEANNPPVLDPNGEIQPQQQVKEGDWLTIDVIEARDPDGDELTIEITSSTLPSVPDFNDWGAGVASFAWRALTCDEGTYNVEFTATDNGKPPLSDSLSVTIIVTSDRVGNEPPIIDAPFSQNGFVSKLLVFDFSVSDQDECDYLMVYPFDFCEAIEILETGACARKHGDDNNCDGLAPGLPCYDLDWLPSGFATEMALDQVIGDLYEFRWVPQERGNFRLQIVAEDGVNSRVWSNVNIDVQ
jgi:hypothetical protein